MPEQGKNQLRKRKILLFLLSYRGKMRKKKIPLLYHCTIFMLYYVCDLSFYSKKTPTSKVGDELRLYLLDRAF